MGGRYPKNARLSEAFPQDGRYYGGALVEGLSMIEDIYTAEPRLARIFLLFWIRV